MAEKSLGCDRFHQSTDKSTEINLCILHREHHSWTPSCTVLKDVTYEQQFGMGSLSHKSLETPALALGDIPLPLAGHNRRWSRVAQLALVLSPKSSSSRMRSVAHGMPWNVN